MALASTLTLDFMSHRTHDHILLCDGSGSLSAVHSLPSLCVFLTPNSEKVSFLWMVSNRRACTENHGWFFGHVRDCLEERCWLWKIQVYAYRNNSCLIISKTCRGGEYTERIKCVSCCSALSVRSIFRSDKYIASYVWDAHRRSECRYVRYLLFLSHFNQ